MKLRCLLLLLLVTNVLSDKTVNPEDADKQDQHGAETKNIASTSSSSSSSTSGIDLLSTTKKSSHQQETLRAEETKYSIKPEVAPLTSSSSSPRQHHQAVALTAAATTLHQQYQTATASATVSPRELGNQVGDYAELPAYESFKYAIPAPDYGQDAQNDDATRYLQAAMISNDQQQHYYLQQQPQQQQQQQQHQQQKSQQQEQGRSYSQSASDYDLQQPPQQQHQEQYYQEVLLGNQQHQQPPAQPQSQKTFVPKYADASDDKDTYYINIPTSQLLAYYQQNYGVVEPKSISKSSEQYQPQSQQQQQQQQQPTQHQQHQQPQPQAIPIPIYMPMLTRSQVYAPAKVTYQQPEVQYVPVYPRAQSMFTNKPTKAAVPTAATTTLTATAAATTTAPVAHQVPVPATSQQPHYATQIEYLANPYHQYYLAQQAAQQHQPQSQQLVFDSAAYADIYGTGTSSADYVQDDNSLYEHSGNQQQQQQHTQMQHQPQLYVPAALAEQIMAQILQQAGIPGAAEVVHQAVKEMQEQPIRHFSPPQYQAQKFRDSEDANSLVPVSDENEGYSAKSYSSATTRHHQPKTLLDTYVPSHVIAAQDANRERPIKLESGFLPSKINFIHRRSYKKRKTD